MDSTLMTTLVARSNAKLLPQGKNARRAGTSACFRPAVTSPTPSRSSTHGAWGVVLWLVIRGPRAVLKPMLLFPPWGAIRLYPPLRGPSFTMSLRTFRPSVRCRCHSHQLRRWLHRTPPKLRRQCGRNLRQEGQCRQNLRQEKMMPWKGPNRFISVPFWCLRTREHWGGSLRSPKMRPRCCANRAVNNGTLGTARPKHALRARFHLPHRASGLIPMYILPSAR